MPAVRRGQGEFLSCDTGRVLALCEATYTDVMAINHNKLRVDKMVLTKALFAFLAQVAKKHACHNRRDFAGVATQLGCNQRRSIISPPAAERAPD